MRCASDSWRVVITASPAISVRSVSRQRQLSTIYSAACSVLAGAPRLALSRQITIGSTLFFKSGISSALGSAIWSNGLRSSGDPSFGEDFDQLPAQF